MVSTMAGFEEVSFLALLALTGRPVKS